MLPVDVVALAVAVVAVAEEEVTAVDGAEAAAASPRAEPHREDAEERVEEDAVHHVSESTS